MSALRLYVAGAIAAAIAASLAWGWIQTERLARAKDALDATRRALSACTELRSLEGDARNASDDDLGNRLSRGR